MKHSLSANTFIKPSDIKNYNPVVIYWVGGTYGNFVYRMLHRYISGFPTINDNFNFENGSSHEVYDFQYTDDLNIDYYKEEIKIKILNDINFDLIAFKKHSSQKIDISKHWLVNESFYNIRISIPDKSLFLFFVIQNMLKLDEKTKFAYYIKDKNFKLDWIIENNFSKLSELEIFFDGIVNSLHSSWHNVDYSDRLYSISVTDILNADNFYQHFLKISRNLNQTMLKDKELFYEDHAVFLQNQQFLDSYYRYQTKNFDHNNIIDRLMKKFS
jgi:hypothetical protein